MQPNPPLDEAYLLSWKAVMDNHIQISKTSILQ